MILICRDRNTAFSLHPGFHLYRADYNFDLTGRSVHLCQLQVQIALLCHSRGNPSKSSDWANWSHVAT